MDKQKLIMLFGLPRSGTTWVGKLFDSRPDSYYLHEPDSVHLDTTLPIFPLPEGGISESAALKIRQWLSCKDEKVVASLPFFKKSYMNPLQWLLFLSTAYLTKVLYRINFPLKTKPIRWQKKPPIVVWKSIESLGSLAYFSQPKHHYAVHIIRNPCGHIASTLRGLKGKHFVEEGSILEDWQLYQMILDQSGEQRYTLDDMKKMEPEQRLALRWAIVNDFVLLHANKACSQVLIYEELCRDPMAALTSVFEQLGLTMPNETKAYIQHSTSANKDDYYATQKDPLTAANSWKKQLTQRQVNNIKAIVSNFECSKYYQDDFDLELD